MKQIDVLCVGATAYDLYFGIDRRPGPDEKTTANAFLSCGGGPAANAAVTVAKLGGTAALVGYLGRDVPGDSHLAELHQAGVDTSWIVRGDFPTPVSSIWITPDGRRSLVNYRDKRAILRADPVRRPKIPPKVVLFDGHEPDVSADLLSQIGLQGPRTVLDAGSVHEGTKRLFEAVDYLVCSRVFAADMTGYNAPQAALQALASTNKNVVITLGEDGLIYQAGTLKGTMAAFPVNTVDTTGAGDVFHGAFCAALAAGMEWIETLRYASAAAALSCTRLGGRTGIPTASEVSTFLSRSSDCLR